MKFSFDWLFGRLSEPSTYAGLGIIASTVMVLSGDDERAPAVAAGFQAAAETVAVEPTTIGIAGGVLGGLAVFFSEKKNR